MPKPISQLGDGAGFHVDTETLARRPVLATLVAQIIADWSMVENYWAIAFVMLVGEEADTTLAIYSSLTSAGAKDGAMLALARQRLNASDLELFEAVTALSKKARGLRDKIAHGLIGESSLAPDALAIADQRLMTEQLYLLFIKQHSSGDLGSSRKLAADKFNKGVHIYSESDLKGIVARIAEAQDLVMDLAVICAPVHPQKPKSYAALHANDAIKRHVERQRRRTEQRAQDDSA